MEARPVTMQKLNHPKSQRDAPAATYTAGPLIKRRPPAVLSKDAVLVIVALSDPAFFSDPRQRQLDISSDSGIQG